MTDGTEKTQNLQTAQRDTTNFAVTLVVLEVVLGQHVSSTLQP